MSKNKGVGILIAFKYVDCPDTHLLQKRDAYLRDCVKCRVGDIVTAKGHNGLRIKGFISNISQSGRATIITLHNTITGIPVENITKIQ